MKRVFVKIFVYKNFLFPKPDSNKIQSNITL